MKHPATIDGESTERRAGNGANALGRGGWMVLVRSLLSKTRLLHRVVRSLFKPTGALVSPILTLFSSLLLKPTEALMLVGIRSAGAGGGGPGH